MKLDFFLIEKNQAFFDLYFCIAHKTTFYPIFETQKELFSLCNYPK